MLPDRVFSTFHTASRGMAVQQKVIAAATSNIAHASTTAPEGAQNVYRPLSVKSGVDHAGGFRRALLDSVSSLQQSHPGHFSSAGTGAARGDSAPGSRNLGPMSEIVEIERFRHEFDPQHPDADENGMVRYPDVDLIEEMARMVRANRLFEANLTAVEAEKQIIKRSLEI